METARARDRGDREGNSAEGVKDRSRLQQGSAAIPAGREGPLRVATHARVRTAHSQTGHAECDNELRDPRGGLPKTCDLVRL